MQSLGDRMKANYEDRARHRLTRRMPVIVRVDGRAFHSYTRDFDRPFDRRIMHAMEAGARAVAAEQQGFKAAYVQSDEASFLLTDYDDLATEAWFGYVKSKVETISASVMTAEFNRWMASSRPDLGRLAQFDARAFNLPREEVANYFLWRARDWERNSVAMYCRAFYSDRDMHGQGLADQHEMLHRAGKNWATDLRPRERNGVWLFANGGRSVTLRPVYPEISAALEPLVYCDREGPGCDLSK